MDYAKDTAAEEIARVVSPSLSAWSKIKHQSDCGRHNAPALPRTACDCDSGLRFLRRNEFYTHEHDSVVESLETMIDYAQSHKNEYLDKWQEHDVTGEAERLIAVFETDIQAAKAALSKARGEPQ